LIVLADLVRSLNARGVPKRPCLQFHGNTERPGSLQGSKPFKKPKLPFTAPAISDVIDVFGPALGDKRAGVRQAGSLRPASRDLSGDARSGNANQIIHHSKQASNSKQSIRQDFLSCARPSSRVEPARQSTGFKRVRARTWPIAWSHLEASRQYLLFTMYQNRRETKVSRNLCFLARMTFCES